MAPERFRRCERSIFEPLICSVICSCPSDLQFILVFFLFVDMWGLTADGIPSSFRFAAVATPRRRRRRCLCRRLSPR
uniref:Uncharacterized protein n=1 Tax=Setaria viridis TaxID=4556 RepID=A0A4U6TTZ8_SETVI|nr:hypothetical protein SEVIR_7G227150v2 [Setaria viridis]